MDKAQLEVLVSRLCGFAVEITIRGDRDFTLSAEGDCNFDRAVAYFRQSGQLKSVSREYDRECDLTCLYFTVRGPAMPAHSRGQAMQGREGR